MAPRVDFLEAGVLEEMQFLVNSRTRIRVLATLTQGHWSESELTDELGEPQATIHQNLGKLVDNDLAAADDAGYTATWRGAVLADVVADYGRRVATVDDLAEFLTHVSVADVNVPVLEGATVTATRPNRPEATIDRTMELLDGATSIQALTPYIVPRFVEVVQEHVVEGGHEFELVTGETAADVLLEDYTDAVRTSLETSRASLFVASELPSFAVLFVDDRLVLGAFDDAGIPRAMVETTDDAALDWARELYAQYRDTARALGLNDL